MELAEYVKILKKNLYLVALFTVLGVVLALVFASKINKGPSYQQLFFLNSPKEAAANANYSEGFYAIEKARNFTDTALAIISSPDFANEVKGNGDLVSAKKIAPLVIRLTVNARDLDGAQSTLNKTKDRFNQKVVELTESEQFQLAPIGTAIVPVTAQPPRWALIVFGAFAGLVFALVTISLKTYFKL